MNLYPTAKALVDGLVRLGKLPEDTNAHVRGPWMDAYGVDRGLAGKGAAKPARVRFHVWVLEYDVLRF